LQPNGLRIQLHPIAVHGEQPMSKRSTGSSMIKGLAGLLTTTKGAVLTVVVTCVIIAAVGFGFWYVRDVAPTIWTARSMPTSTALPTATATLAPTATATALPTATAVPTATALPRAKPAPTVVSAPHLSVNSYFINETNCTGNFTPYGITLKNSGGGTVRWQGSTTYSVLLNTYAGSLAAGQSQQVTMSWYNNTAGAPPTPPHGSITVTFTSNGGNQQVFVGCP
jgi:hypothetical protein